MFSKLFTPAAQKEQDDQKEQVDQLACLTVNSNGGSLRKVEDFKWVMHVADNLPLYLHDSVFVVRGGTNNRKYFSLGREDRDLLDEVLNRAIKENTEFFFDAMRKVLLEQAKCLGNDVEAELDLLKAKIREVSTTN